MKFRMDSGDSIFAMEDEGLTYDDVLLLPQHSRVLPHEVSLTSKFSRNINLNLPLLSAAMDTVTESATAIAMAHAGGLGIVHKNLSIEEQAREVRRVKKSEAGMVIDPVTVQPDDNVGDVIAVMRRFNISGLPVIDAQGLAGIVTGRDIRFEKNLKRPVREVMTVKVITASKGTTPEQAVEILHQHRIEKLPVVEGKSLVGMYTIKDIQKARRHPHAAKDASGRLLVGAAVGAGGDFRDRTAELLDAGCDVIVVDTAHGHAQGVIDAVRQVRHDFRNHPFELVAGNVATPDATIALIESGVDAVKVGIGPGSICTTRVIAGIGVPQFTAVLLCARAARERGVPVIADGGVKFSGDLVKALAAGAGSVMVGSLLAGTDEAPGEMVLFQGKSFKVYRGMGSVGAMARGSKDRYFQADVDESGKLVPEGVEGRVAYKGPLAGTLFQLQGGVRSGMGYVGAATIEDLQAKAKFIRISSAAFRESHVHDVYIEREAPNYRTET
jgi:IMP dehydrogenase